MCNFNRRSGLDGGGSIVSLLICVNRKVNVEVDRQESIVQVLFYFERGTVVVHVVCVCVCTSSRLCRSVWFCTVRV